MYRILIFCVYLHGAMPAYAATVSGNVFDEINNEPIIGANITLQNTSYGTVTDVNGNYSIENIAPGFYNLQVSYLGYRTETKFEVELTNSKPAVINFALKQEFHQIDSIVITPDAFVRKLESPLSVNSIGINEIQRNPGGNRDISKAIQNLPGISKGLGFRNDLLVRGGAPNENRFYLDDIELPVINHFATQGASGGSNGIINVDFISNADFYTGSFPANKGNALSSVLQLTQKEGRKDRAGFIFTLGASEAGITLEGPLSKKKKTTFLLNGRYSYLQGLFKLFGLPFLPTYSDLQFKIAHKFNNKHDLVILGIGAYDKLRLNLKQDETDDQKYILRVLPYQDQWNYTAGVRYRFFMDKSFMIFVLSKSMLGNHIYKYDNNDAAGTFIYDLQSTEAESKARVEFSTRLREFKLSYGINYEFARFTTNTFNNIVLSDTIVQVNYNTDLRVHKYGAFIQLSRSLLKDKLSLSLGVRADGNSYNKHMANLFRQLSPRFSASYAVAPYLQFNFSTGLYYQLPPYTTLGYKDDLNHLVNQPGLKYIRNLHLVSGVSSTFTTNTKISLEGFLKRYYNYPMLLNKGISLANLGGDFGWVGDEPASSGSRGKTYGIEFAVLQKLWKGFFGTVSYTWYRSLFTDTSGTYKPSSWDSRHILNLTFGYKFKRNWELGVKWSVQGGIPYSPYDTAALSNIEVWNATDGNPARDFTRLNSERTTVVHGMNVRIDKKWFFKKWNLDVYLDITNLYNAKDVSPANIDTERDANGNAVVDPNDNTKYKLRFIETNGSNILPTIGVVIEM